MKDKGYWIGDMFVKEGQTISQAFTEYLINSEDNSNYGLNQYEEDLEFLKKVF